MKYLIAAGVLAAGLFVTTGSASAQHPGGGHHGYARHGGHYSHAPRHYGHGGYRGYAGIAPAVGVYAGPVYSPGVAVYPAPVVSPGVVVAPRLGHGHYRHHGHH